MNPFPPFHRLLALVILALATPFALAQSGPVTKTTAGAAKNDLVEDFNIGSGRTVTVKSGGELDASAGTLTLADDQVPWAKVDKTGSTLADLTTRDWSALQNTPTTVAGYGITDAATATSVAAILPAADAVLATTYGAIGDGTTNANAAVEAAAAAASIVDLPYSPSGYALSLPLDLGISRLRVYGDAQIIGATINSLPLEVVTSPNMSVLDRRSGPRTITLPSGFREDVIWLGYTAAGLPTYHLPLDRWDVARNDASAVHYWVDPINGNNANTGLADNVPVRSIGGLVAKLDASGATDPIVVHLAPTQYTREESGSLVDLGKWDRDIAFTSTGAGAVIGYFANFSELTWSADGAAFTATRSGVARIFDRTRLDANGIPLPLTLKASVAEVQETPGSWYTAAGDVWVRLHDDRDPTNDRDLLVSLGTSAWTSTIRNGRTMFFENVHFSWSAAFEIQSSVASTGTSVVFSGCSFFGSVQNGLSTDSVSVVIVADCIAAYNLRDGFNYHGYLAAPFGDVFEVSTVSYQNGDGAAGTINGSTAHDGLHIVRVNTTAFDTYGPIIADVNGCFSFNFGVSAGRSLIADAQTKASFYFDNVSAAAPGAAWLVDCAGGDDGAGTFAISSAAGVEINVRNWGGTRRVHNNVQLTAY